MSDPSPTDGLREGGALHLTLDVDFEDAVPDVQLEHEYAGYETVTVIGLDEMIEGHLGEAVARTPLLVFCHAELAHGALGIDPRLGGMLTCTTRVPEGPDDDRVHVHHVSVAKAIRELRSASSGSDDTVAARFERSGELMTDVWANIEAHADVIGSDESGQGPGWS